MTYNYAGWIVLTLVWKVENDTFYEWILVTLLWNVEIGKKDTKIMVTRKWNNRNDATWFWLETLLSFVWIVEIIPNDCALRQVTLM